jgi:hypothetical protein
MKLVCALCFVCQLPALFTIPASILASLALNVDSATMSALVFTLSEVFVWTYNAPISKTRHTQAH